ncbi:MAG: hypothetical protein EOM19_06610 [Candidatus Moranbacteria bacterium]|nr:hypothetical protein [Candidatus Moranbacteria bacterium]
MTPVELTCKSCGSIEEPTVTEKTFSNGSVHKEARCPSCGAYIKYLAGEPNPLDTMYYGKYKGRTIMSIAKEDPDYAQWASANLKKQKERDSFLLALKSLS